MCAIYHCIQYDKQLFWGKLLYVVGKCLFIMEIIYSLIIVVSMFFHLTYFRPVTFSHHAL